MKHINILKQFLLPIAFVMVAVISATAQPLNGNYTVYGTSPDYTSLSAAISDLNSRGVSGPVSFKIRPGTYTMTGLTINSITGASATNTVTIESESGTYTNTEIQNTNTSSSTSSNFIFQLNGAKYITIQNLTLNKTHSTYGRCIYFVGAAESNSILGCKLTGSASSTTSNGKARIYGTGLGNANNNRVANNIIEYASYAVYWDGTSGNLSDNNTFEDNDIVSPYYYAFYVDYTSNVKILNNKISRTGAGTFYGFYLYECDGSYRVEGNEYKGTSITSTNYPFYIYYSDGTATSKGSIRNNDIDISSSSSIYNYFYYNNYFAFSNNKLELVSTSGTIYPIYNYNASIYGKQVNVDSNKIEASTSSGTVYIYGNYYGDSTTFNNNDIDVAQTTGSNYFYFTYQSPNSSADNNKIKFDQTSGSSYWYGLYYANNSTMDNNEITRESTTGTKYWYNYYSNNSSISGNIVDQKATSSGSIYNYLQYCDNFKFSHNKITHNLTTGSTYPLYCYMYGYTGGEYSFNDITANCTSGLIYGMYNYYLTGVSVFNNKVYVKTSGTCYGMMAMYNATGTKYYNNTIHSDGTGSTNYPGYLYTYSTYGTVEFRNNIWSKSSSSGYVLYCYDPAYMNSDYNNIYSPGTGTKIYDIWNGGTYSTLQSWRSATGNDMNSLMYEPGYTNTSTGDLHPDPTSSSSWSVNGRGIQIAGNTTDLDGNTRAETTVQGVPDLGAYEFTPTSTPPNCTAVPATPTAGGTQTFLFGQDTVARITWDAGSNLPTNTIAMKQYTGTNPPGITSVNPTQMFFYVDGGLGSGTYDFDLDLYYKDPWMGTIASENALRLAEKVGASPWSGYSPAVSSANVNRNIIETPGIADDGLWTGIDVPNNASADAIIEPVTPFCPGTYTVKLRIKNNGNNKINGVKITWERNGIAQGTITYNNTIDINGSANGNEAIITLGNVTFGKNAEHIKAWTHDPNNVTDPVPSDDTLDINLRAALSGVYTIGGTTPDFSTVADAISDLNIYGVCGNVTMNIRPGTYSGQLEMGKIIGAGPNARITFQAENGIASSATITANPSSTAPHVWRFDATEYVTLKNLTVTTANSSYGYLLEYRNAASHDSVIGCDLIAGTAQSSYNMPIYANQQGGADMVFKNNNIQNGYYSVYWYGSSSKYTDGLMFDGNTITGHYYYGMYVYYCAKDFQVNNNIFRPIGGTIAPTSAIYWYNSGLPAGDYSISGNEITGNYFYGIYCYYVYGTSNTHFKVMNNAMSIDNASGTTYYGILLNYAQYCDFINNSIRYNASSGYAAAYLQFSSSTYNDLTVRNNAIANYSASSTYGAFYLYTSTTSTQTSDYNNVYSSSASSPTYYYNGSSMNTLANMRSSSPHEDHSISFDPGFTSSTDLHPDVTNPNAWSLNGRAVQISGNDKDIDGNTRIDQLQNGVPDIGAYEFDPSVAPPLATATPATAIPGQTQVFEFGGNKVAEIDWSSNLYTSPVEVRQYSGDLGVGITTQSPNSYMYFHTDVRPTGSGSTYSYDVDVDYMDIWLGTISQESNLRLAQRFNGSPWTVYNGNGSSVSTANNELSAPSMITFGSFTGVENGEIFSAYVKSLGKTVFCFGDSTELSAEYGNSAPADAYQWYLNGNIIPGATSQTYKVTQPGDYTVVITVGNRSAESIPVTITAVAPPMALVTASGPLTYCTGGNLVLTASQGSNLTYQWKLNGTDINGATNSSYNVQQSGDYEVEVTNIGCSTTSTVTQISAGPLDVQLGTDTSFCEVKNVPLVLDAGYPGAKYTWSTGDTTQTISPAQSGMYVVTVDGGPNCIASDTILVNIDPLPSAKGISFVKTGNNYTFSPSGAQNVSGYLWIFSDGATSTSPVVTRQVTDPSLHVKLVMFNACGSDTLQIGFPVNVVHVKGELAISLYPNPANDHITLSIDGSIKVSEVSIINSVGQELYKTSEVNSNELKLDVRGYSNGYYMLRATTEDGRVMSKSFNILR